MSRVSLFARRLASQHVAKTTSGLANLNPNLDPPARRDVTVILNKGRTQLTPFENGLREIVSDLQQCGDSIMSYIGFMVGIVREFNVTDGLTSKRMIDSIAKFDPDRNGVVDLENFEKWVQIITREALTKQELDNIVEGADIDGDGEFDYTQHVNMIVNTLLQANEKQGQFDELVAAATESGRFLSFEELKQMAAEMIRDEADITTTTNTTNAPQTQIELADKTVFTYIDFLIMDFEHEAKELREERPLLKKFRAIHPEGKSLTPPDFMKFFKLNHERMVERKVSKELTEEELTKQAFDAWMKIDVDASGEVDYDEFIGAIVKNKIKLYL